MTRFILSVLFSLFLLNAFSQSIEIKGDDVYLNDKAFLKYKKHNANQISFFNLTGDEILFYRYENNGSFRQSEDDFVILNFLAANRKVYITDMSRFATLGIKKAMQKLIKWLVEDKVLNESGEIVPEKLVVFTQKYEDGELARKNKQ